MPPPLPLFRLDLFRRTPQAHDALCRREERAVRDSGLFDHLGFAERREAIAAVVRERLPWAAERCGWVQTELRDGRFYADLYLQTEGKRPKYRESFLLGVIDDAPDLLREAFQNVPTLVAGAAPAGGFVDVEPYAILVERFDFRRFCGDHRTPAPAALAERARRWN